MTFSSENVQDINLQQQTTSVAIWPRQVLLQSQHTRTGAAWSESTTEPKKVRCTISENEQELVEKAHITTGLLKFLPMDHDPGGSQTTACVAWALSCGVLKRDSNETKYLKEALEMTNDWQAAFDVHLKAMGIPLEKRSGARGGSCGRESTSEAKKNIGFSTQRGTEERFTKVIVGGPAQSCREFQPPTHSAC